MEHADLTRKKHASVPDTKEEPAAFWTLALSHTWTDLLLAGQYILCLPEFPVQQMLKNYVNIFGLCGKTYIR